MAKFAFEDILYFKRPKQEIFDFDKLAGPGIYNLLYETDLQRLYNIATSIKYSGDLKKKYSEMNNILKPRGFAHFHRGTNRVVYKHYENPNILIKVPIDLAGCADGMMEFKNQNLLKPFVTKVFDIHPSGVSVHERVVPITSYADFSRFAYEYFQLVSHVFLGKYVMDDIGEKSFMNWGFRYRFGLVLLDFPYLYQLDYQRLVCHKYLPETGQICYGEIDYDDGFNHLVCKKCGSIYDAKNIGKAIENYEINIIKEDEKMGNGTFRRRIVLVRGNDVVTEFNPTQMESNTILSKDQFRKVDKQREYSAPRIITSSTEERHVVCQKPVFNNNIPKFVSKKDIEEKETVVSTDDKVEEVVEQTQPEEVSEVEKYVSETKPDPIEEIEENTPDEEEGDSSSDSRFQDAQEETSQQDEEHEQDVQVQQTEENVNLEEEQNSKEQEEVVEEDKPQQEEKQEEEQPTLSNNLNAYVAELAGDKLDVKLLSYAAQLLDFGSKIQDIDKLIKDFSVRKFHGEDQEKVYLSYMDAISRLSQYISEEKSKIMDPHQQKLDAEAAEKESAAIKTVETLKKEYYDMMDNWVKADYDPRGNLPGISEDTVNVTFEMFSLGLKTALTDVLDEELGKEGTPAMFDDKEQFVDKTIQLVIQNNMEYVQKWIKLM